MNVDIQPYNQETILLETLSYSSVVALIIISYLICAVVDDWFKFRLRHSLDKSDRPRFIIVCRVVVWMLSILISYNISNSIAIFSNGLLEYKLFPKINLGELLLPQDYLIKSAILLLVIALFVELIRFGCYCLYKSNYTGEVYIQGDKFSLYMEYCFMYKGELIDIVTINDQKCVNLNINTIIYSRYIGKGPIYRIDDVVLGKNEQGLDIYKTMNLTAIKKPIYSLI